MNEHVLLMPRHLLNKSMEIQSHKNGKWIQNGDELLLKTIGEFDIMIMIWMISVRELIYIQFETS